MEPVPAPNYTQIPNSILDAMAEMSGSEFKVVMAIARQTFGWHKSRDKISLSQLQELTGLSRQGVVNAVAAAIEAGFVGSQIDSSDNLGGIWYWLIIEETSQKNGLVNKTDQSKKLTKTSQKNGLELVKFFDLQKKGNKRKKDHHPLPPQADAKKTIASNQAADGGGGGSIIEGTEHTELYHWLRANGVDSPEAAKRNQHHQLEAVQAMFRKMVGDSVGEQRKLLVGRFVKALDADGPPKPPPPRQVQPIACQPISPPDQLSRAEIARKLRELEQR